MALFLISQHIKELPQFFMGTTLHRDPITGTWQGVTSAVLDPAWQAQLYTGFPASFAVRCTNALVVLQVSGVDPKPLFGTAYWGPTPTNSNISIDIQAQLFPTRCWHQAMAVDGAAILLTLETLGWCRGSHPGCRHLHFPAAPQNAAREKVYFSLPWQGDAGAYFNEIVHPQLRYPTEHPFWSQKIWKKEKLLRFLQLEG